ncbi:MAG: hypothetical protein AB9879_09985 [Methanothrix sp.]
MPEKIFPRNVTSMSMGGRIRFGSVPTLCGRNNYVQRYKTSGTDLKKPLLGGCQMRPCRDIKQDTFSKNEIGETIRLAKAKFGKKPFIEAYKKALNTSKEINDRRKKCLEEEVRLRSVLRAGED